MHKLPVFVIQPGLQKIGQHAVGVGGADQTANGAAQALGQVAGQDIPKIASGHGEVHRLPGQKHFLVPQFLAGLDVIHHLRD